MKNQEESSKKSNKAFVIICYLLFFIIPGILYFFKDEYFYCYMGGLISFGTLLMSDSFLKLKKYDLKINKKDIFKTRVALINYSISFIFVRIILNLLNFRKFFISIAKAKTKGWNFGFVLSVIFQPLVIWFIVMIVYIVLNLIENHIVGNKQDNKDA